MRGTAWSQEEIDAVRRLYEGGYSDDQIGYAIKRSEGAVSNCRQKHGIIRPRHALKRAPEWTAQELEIGRLLYESGIPNKEIAYHLGRTAIAIKRAITCFKWKRNPDCGIEPEIFDTEDEKWRFSVVRGYLVSSRGRIMSVVPGRVGCIIKAWSDKWGYKHVNIGAKAKRYAVHLLVITAFHGPKPSPTHQCAHNDGQPANNAETNLRWATPAENQADRLAHGTALRHSNGRFISSNQAGVKVWRVDDA